MRMVRLYEFFQMGVMPWHWDYEYYTGSADKDWMRKNQMFYPEDLENIKGIQEYEKQRKGK